MISDLNKKGQFGHTQRRGGGGGRGRAPVGTSAQERPGVLNRGWPAACKLRGSEVIALGSPAPCTPATPFRNSFRGSRKPLLSALSLRGRSGLATRPSVGRG